MTNAMPRGPMTLQLETHYSQRYAHYVPPETTPEQIMTPAWWSNVAARLRPGDEVKVLAEDMSWRAMFVVLATGRVEAFVHMLDWQRMDAARVRSDDAAYYVKWGGPHAKFRVHRKTDDEVVKGDFQSKDDAELWVKNHMKAAA